ncbi:MAG: serine/threonine-protein kinase [Myxococcota bacterium]
MTAQWALQMGGETTHSPLWEAAGGVIARFADGAATPSELPMLAQFSDALARGVPMSALLGDLRQLNHDGYLRGAMVAMASSLQALPRPDVALALGRELMDAIDPALGVALCRAVLALDEVDTHRYQPGSTFVAANRILGESLLESGDPSTALRHFEAVLSVDVDDPRALRGWSESTRTLERRGMVVEHRTRGLSLLEGLDELELDAGLAGDRYEIQRPLGRGRHAVVYQAFDRHVGREVAIKRLLDAGARTSAVPPRVIAARFFAEATTLARVRSPYVVALLDAQPSKQFIALELCRGGNLRLALRRGLIDASDLPRIGGQLRAALQAVHAAGAVHRDVKPANILVRSARRGATIALGDFGLAVGPSKASASGRGGTLRYLAPELRTRDADATATARSDRFSAGAVLLELALGALPAAFDHVDGGFDATAFVPDALPGTWSERLRALLSADPEARTW